MPVVLLVLLLGLKASAQFAFPEGHADKRLCFHSQSAVRSFATAMDTYADHMYHVLLQKKKNVEPVRVFADLCTNCLVFEGGGYIREVIEERYVEAEKFLNKPGDTPLIMPVDVSIGGLFPDNRFYIPFLRFPYVTQNILYDHEKNPIKVSAQVLHPEIIEYTFEREGQIHRATHAIGDWVYCLFPPTENEFYANKISPMPLRPPYYVKEAEKFIELPRLGMKAFYRDGLNVPASSKEAEKDMDASSLPLPP